MSQRKEKYSRNMERRVDKLEDRVEKMDTELTAHAIRLFNIEEDLAVYNAAVSAREEKRIREELAAKREVRNERRERERNRKNYLAAAVLCVLLAFLVLIVVARAKETNDAAEVPLLSTETIKVASTPVPETVIHILASSPVPTESADPLEGVPVWEWPEDVLLAHGYYSTAVPMPYEYQGYMRRYCEEYGILYTMALAVAETESDFDMDAVGSSDEVGIMQLNPGPGGSYHDELEDATGMDPTTPEGNIAGGCYLLGKYMAEFGDVEKAAMAYNMGRAGAMKAWAEGITSTAYSREVAQHMEAWGCAVNAWNGV